MPISEERLHEDLTAIRNTELQTLWSVHNFFAIIHLGSLGFVATQVTDPILLGISSVIGGFLGSVWLWAAFRMWRWLRYWNSKLVELQASIDDRLRVFGGPNYERETETIVGVSSAIQAMIVVIIAIWAALFLATYFGYPLPGLNKGE